MLLAFFAVKIFLVLAVLVWGVVKHNRDLARLEALLDETDAELQELEDSLWNR